MIMQCDHFTQSSSVVELNRFELTLEALQQICPGYQTRSPWLNIEYISLILTSTSDSLSLQVLTNYYNDGECLAQMCDRHGWELVADRFGSWEIFIPWFPFPICAWGGCTINDILNRIYATHISFDQWLSLRQITGQTKFPPRWSKQWLNPVS